MNFHYRTNAEKFMHISFNKLKKTPFLGQLFFKENPVLSRKTSYGFQTQCQNLEKTKHPIPMDPIP